DYYCQVYDGSDVFF
nr:immunoglobulin light chain junction region [Macaca mulatta]MOV94574.1 immunoglobulin light chain junction region [Macaca mulatta]